VSSKNPIPQDYEAWRDCITIRCGLTLTDKYIEQRLTELRQSDHPRTSEFAKLYGSQQLATTIRWFERAASEAKASRK